MSDERCDDDIYRFGRPMCMVHGTRQFVNDWVMEVRRRSGFRVDWHYAGGRAVVKVIVRVEEDSYAAVRAIEEARPFLRGQFLSWLSPSGELLGNGHVGLA